jgi:hypothetical protein
MSNWPELILVTVRTGDEGRVETYVFRRMTDVSDSILVTYGKMLDRVRLVDTPDSITVYLDGKDGPDWELCANRLAQSVVLDGPTHF